MKKILLTTILGLGVAFGGRETLNIKSMGWCDDFPLSLNIQNQIENVCFGDRNSELHKFLSNILWYLRRICTQNDKNKVIEKDDDDSPLFIALKKIFPDAKHLYYCYNNGGADFNIAKDMYGGQGTLSFFLTSKDVEIDDRTFEIKGKKDVHYIGFGINYDGVYINNTGKRVGGFRKYFYPSGKAHFIHNIEEKK